MTKRLVAAAACLALAASACSTDAPGGEPDDSTVVYHTDYPAFDTPDALGTAADLVVEGTVLGSTVREIDIRSAPEEGADPESDPGLGAADAPEPAVFVYTVHEVEVASVVQGEAEAGSVIEVKQLGGLLDGVQYVEAGAVGLRSGEAHVLFLSGTPDDGIPFSLINAVQGAYSVEGAEEIEPLHPENDLAVTSDGLAEMASER